MTLGLKTAADLAVVEECQTTVKGYFKLYFYDIMYLIYEEIFTFFDQWRNINSFHIWIGLEKSVLLFDYN